MPRVPRVLRGGDLNSATRPKGLCYRDERAACVVGRTAKLELVFERRRGRTMIAHAYVEPPFRIGQSFAIDDAAYVIVVCSGPGVFAGDTLQQSIRVERRADVGPRDTRRNVAIPRARAHAAAAHRRIAEVSRALSADTCGSLCDASVGRR